MPSGYERSEDYGGPPKGPLDWVGAAILVALLTLVMWKCQGAVDAQTPLEVVGRASVVDGDTIEIRGLNVRLWGIDAPEGAQICIGPERAQEPAGRRSAAALAGIVAGRNVACRQRDLDRYGRPVSLCRVGDLDLSGAMIERGWAWAFIRYTDPPGTGDTVPTPLWNRGRGCAPLVQVSVTVVPAVMLVSEAVNVPVGAAMFTVMVTCLVIVPPAPVSVRV